MKWSWKRAPILAQTMPVSTKKLELEAAKQILAEIFRIRPAEVDDMLMKRLEGREDELDGLWPAMFCLGE